jgi:prepilin-type N-terminal cleavage/methylation domain-containing protein
MFQILKQIEKSVSAKGFTLVEMLVVVSIIAIIGGFVTSAVFSGRTEARDMSRQTDLEQIKLGLKLYREAHGEYPDYPEGIEIGVGHSIDQELAPFLGTVKADPLSATGGGGEYGYWYSNNYFCKGENRVAVMAKTMEKEKFENFETVCGTPGGSSIELPWFVKLTADTAFASHECLFRILFFYYPAGCDIHPPANNNNTGSSCQATLPSSQLCSFDISASRTSLPAGGGDVTICWAFDTAHSDPPRAVTGGGISWSNGSSDGVVRGERTIRVDQTTTFTAQARQDANGGNPNISCPADTVTVTVPVAVVEEIPGCMDSQAQNYDSDATQDDGSCIYEEEPGLSERFGRVLIVN